MSEEEYCLTFFGKQVEYCLNSTCHFYVIKPGTSGLPIANGCGILLKLFDNYYCLSNAHVLGDEKIGQNFLITGDRKKITLGGHVFFNRINSETSRRYDRIDIAAMKLTQETVETLKIVGYNFLNISDLRLNHSLVANDVVFIAGYPGNWSKISKSQRLIIDKPFIGRSIPYTGDLSKLGLDLSYHHAIIYSRNILVDSKTKENKTGPKPHGISGSGIWLVSGGESTSTYKHELIGIFSEYIENRAVVAGIRIELFLDFLSQTP